MGRLTLHIELKHTNALAYDKKKQADSFKELFCPFCEKTFRDKNEFTGHISKVMYGQCPSHSYQKIEKKSTMEEKKDNVLSDSKIGKPQNVEEKTVTKKSAAVHEEKESFKCVCGRKFATKIALEVHYTEVHGKKKPFQCSICSKAFSSKENIRIHISAVHRRKFNVDDFIHEEKNPKPVKSISDETDEAVKNIPKNPSKNISPK